MIACVILHNMILDDEEDVEGLEDIIGDLAKNNIPVRHSHPKVQQPSMLHSQLHLVANFQQTLLATTETGCHSM
jgi:hypothetical protein